MEESLLVRFQRHKEIYMQVIAKTKGVQISPRKVRLVADAVRNLPIMNALDALQLLEKRAAKVIGLTVKSAIANATNNNKLDTKNMKIARIEVSEGISHKRYHPSTRGRIHPYKKRTSQITIVLEEVNNGTKS